MSEMPTWEGFMIPTLRVLSDGVVRHLVQLEPLVADEIELNEEQRLETLPSGDTRYKNRIGWAVSFLTNVGALERPKRAHYLITEAGRQLIQIFPNGVRERDLTALGEDPASPIRIYQPSKPRPKQVDTVELEDSLMTSTEQVQSGIERIHEEIRAELLGRLQGKEPAFFEKAVVDLLLAMGYGGAHGRGAVTQLTNDAGIDGVIDQDALGLNKVYIQAKRYSDDNKVGRPEVQSFVGALSGKADGGLFITTGRFSNGAIDYAEKVPARIILVDGQQLARLMIRYGVGVEIKQTFHVVGIDEDFFA